MAYDTFKLATHAAATVVGLEVSLDHQDYDEWCLFTPGPNGMKRFETPNAWFRSLHSAGFRSAFFGPETGLPHRHWGLLIDRPGERYFGKANGSTVSEENRSWRRCWFMPEKTPETAPPPSFDLPTLARDLHRAIDAMLRFAREHRPEETYFIDRLTSARDLAGAAFGDGPSVPIPEGLRALYPQVGFSPARMCIGAAVFQSNLFGGMGSWNDWGSRYAEVEKRFESVNETYSQLRGPSLIAASMVG
jgi:hypothetical protein